MKNYYIASGLENAAAVKDLKKILDEAGWHHTYDWTVHGSVQGDAARCREVATREMEDGVLGADVVIVLLPGGRGTHVELGMACTARYYGECATLAGDPPQTPRIVLYSPDPERDFGTNGTTRAFYHHPLVERFSSMDEMIASLLGAS